MKLKKIYQEFEVLAERLEIKIIHGKGNFSGGYCIIENEPVIVINKNKPIDQRVKKFAEVFSKMDISNIAMRPVIREMIESEKVSKLF